MNTCWEIQPCGCHSRAPRRYRGARSSIRCSFAGSAIVSGARSATLADRLGSLPPPQPPSTRCTPSQRRARERGGKRIRGLKDLGSEEIEIRLRLRSDGGCSEGESLNWTDYLSFEFTQDPQVEVKQLDEDEFYVKVLCEQKL
ncbi:hypothetical protein J5N97_011810 [Dioscorea zingiberensis]|uniref:Uncharacterized protein n=1 Tax=Dioscorea zingiberensis TaxID=325984 RepID=A0A9D5D179_9LILI|nr:hypothetical protein J5N97_011810 [Dioscorea zingiberensis]